MKHEMHAIINNVRSKIVDMSFPFEKKLHTATPVREQHVIIAGIITYLGNLGLKYQLQNITPIEINNIIRIQMINIFQ